MDFHNFSFLLFSIILCAKYSFSLEPALNSSTLEPALNNSTFKPTVNSSTLNPAVNSSTLEPATHGSTFESAINGLNNLTLCSGFIDIRYGADSKNRHSIIIPEHRTSRKISSHTLPIGPIKFNTQTNQQLKCAEEKTEVRKITLDFHLEPVHVISPRGRNFQNVSAESIKSHAHSYFTTSGYFYDNVTNNFYKPNGDYCVASYSDHEISLKVCIVSEDCSSASSQNVWCLPKCCAADEVLLFWQQQCVRRSETDGVTPWFPPIFQDVKHPNKELTNIANKIVFNMANFPDNCNTLNHTDGSQRRGPIYKWLSASATTHPKYKNQTAKKDHVKLLAPSGGKNGKIKAMLLNEASRQWMVVKDWTHFCVDGFYVKSDDTPTYSGKADNFAMFYCDTGTEQVNVQSTAKSWIYSFMSLLAVCFLLAIIVIYTILWDKQNVHGLTILSYTITTFWGNLFLLAAHLVYFVSEDAQKFIGVTTRGAICYGIAVMAHYFVLSSYAWLTIMNLDLWLTFNSVRVKKNAKDWGRFSIYSFFAWGLPFMLVIAFIVVNEKYRDPTTLVPVPDYATSTCFVSPDFRGEYVYAPMAILLGINTILIALTMKIFIEARCQMTKAFSGSNTNQYSAKLFCKLFIVMGGTSLIDFLTWYYNAKDKPWLVVVLESINYLFTPFFLFVLFCLNNRTVSQLREKYPAVIDKLHPILKVIVRLDGRPEHSRSGSARKTSLRTVGRHDSGTESMSMKTITLSSNAL